MFLFLDIQLLNFRNGNHVCSKPSSMQIEMWELMIIRNLFGFISHKDICCGPSGFIRSDQGVYWKIRKKYTRIIISFTYLKL